MNFIKDRVETITSTIEEHDRALYGNNGNVGVVAKVVSSVETLEDLKMALRGKGEDPGLIADIRTLMNWMGDWKDERKWLARVIIGVVITQLIGYVLIFLK